MRVQPEQSRLVAINVRLEMQASSGGLARRQGRTVHIGNRVDEVVRLVDDDDLLL